MTRRNLVIGAAAAALPLGAQHAKEVRITIPHIDKRDLVEILGTFFSKGDEAIKQRFQDVVGKSEEVTVVLTSKNISDDTIQIEVL